MRGNTEQCSIRLSTTARLHPLATHTVLTPHSYVWSYKSHKNVMSTMTSGNPGMSEFSCMAKSLPQLASLLSWWRYLNDDLHVCAEHSQSPLTAADHISHSSASLPPIERLLLVGHCYIAWDFECWRCHCCMRSDWCCQLRSAVAALHNLLAVSGMSN